LELGLQRLMVDDYFIYVLQKCHPGPTLLQALTAEPFKEAEFRNAFKKCLKLFS
jgi:hypothetical protein